MQGEGCKESGGERMKKEFANDEGVKRQSLLNCWNREGVKEESDTGLREGNRRRLLTDGKERTQR